MIVRIVLPPRDFRRLNGGGAPFCSKRSQHGSWRTLTGLVADFACALADGRVGTKPRRDANLTLPIESPADGRTKFDRGEANRALPGRFTMTTILLTSGRGVYALALARAFRAGGARVLAADCWPRTLCRYSSAVSRYFQVPSPARAAGDWFAALLRIVDEQSVDLIVPVYEETFYLARAVAGRSSAPAVFSAPFETLIGLHNKWLFIERARAIGLSVPRTTFLDSRAELEREFRRRGVRSGVYKPVYSRFATQTVVRPRDAEMLSGIEPTPRTPWVAQDFLPGRPYATFSVAHNGKITAHATYATDFCHDLGPSLVYRRAEHRGVFDWTRRFIEATQYTGQIGLDFIEDETGSVSAIECNPRLTGGMYLLKDDPRFLRAYLDPQTPRIDASDRSYAFRFWLLYSLFHHTRSFPGVREWWRNIVRARSTNELVWTDPKPRLMSPMLAAWFLYRCWAENQTARCLVTRDFEWSEERPDFDVAGGLESEAA